MDHRDTRPMKRLPDSPPRIAYRLRFLILMGVGVDLALLGLLGVLYLTPIHPNYPAQSIPAQSPQAPSIVSVPLPMGTVTPKKAVSGAVSATVKPSQAAPVHRAAPTTHKPSTAPPVAPVTTAPTVVKSPSPTEPDPTGSG